MKTTGIPSGDCLRLCGGTIDPNPKNPLDQLAESLANSLRKLPGLKYVAGKGMQLDPPVFYGTPGR